MRTGMKTIVDPLVVRMTAARLMKIIVARAAEMTMRRIADLTVATTMVVKTTVAQAVEMKIVMKITVVPAEVETVINGGVLDPSS